MRVLVLDETGKHILGSVEVAGTVKDISQHARYFFVLDMLEDSIAFTGVRSPAEHTSRPTILRFCPITSGLEHTRTGFRSDCVSVVTDTFIRSRFRSHCRGCVPTRLLQAIRADFGTPAGLR